MITIPYRIGDRIINNTSKTEWTIISILDNSYAGKTYRIRSSSAPSNVNSLWIFEEYLNLWYSPVSPVLKILFDRGSEATKPCSANYRRSVENGLDGDPSRGSDKEDSK